MINRELPKSQKKIARQIIEKGLQKEYENGIGSRIISFPNESPTV